MAASDYCGGFWGGSYASPAVEAYAAACAAASEGAAGVSPGRLRAWTLSYADRVDGSTSAGRPVYGYPEPEGSPRWIAADLVGGRVLVAGLDFDASGGYVWFDDDPSNWATVRRLAWDGDEAVEVSDLFYCSADDPEVAAPEPATRAALSAAVALACDSPATGVRETVEDVWQAWDGSWRVVTDAAAYGLVEADEPSVAAGDVLPAGTPLGSAWTLTKLGPSLPNLTHLTVPESYHQGAVGGPITWYNGSRAVTVDTSSGRTRVRWPLGGDSGDVADFWTESHARGTASGATSLAEAMDTRADPNDNDPGPESLPTTVNPLEFICRELFAGNAYLLMVFPERFGPAAATAAARVSAVREAAGPYATVFEYEDEMPALTEVNP